jgi:hypothetical protein
MDAIDAAIFAALALIDLAFLFCLRWRRGRQGRIERRVVRALRLAYVHL